MPKGRRVGLHVRFADWLSDLPGGGDEFVEILAHHLEQACLLAREVGRTEVPAPVERAVEALRRAGEKAELHEGMREAHRFYTRALALVPDADSAHAHRAHAPVRARADRARRAPHGRAGARGGRARERRARARRRSAATRSSRSATSPTSKGSRTRRSARSQAAERLAGEIGNRRLAIRAAYEAAWARRLVRR